MSYLFEEVYFPLIEDMLKASQMKQNSKKSSQKKKYSLEDQNSSGKKKSQNFVQQNFRYVGDIQKQTLVGLSQQYNYETKDKYMTGQNRRFQTQNNLSCQQSFFLTQNNNTEKSFSQNGLFKLQKESQKDLKQKIFHTELKQSLISNASSFSKSQRLETIFQSARKQKTQKSRTKIYQSKNKRMKLNDQMIDESNGYESRNNMRKSFCLKMVQDDQQWQETCSKSLRNKK